VNLGSTKGHFTIGVSSMEVSQLKELKELREENSKLKRMYAEQTLMLEMAKDVISKKW
jgi:putative transposase